MALVWPVTLPAYPLIDGYEEQAPKITLRSTVDAGPPKVRRRFTAGISKITCKYTVSRELMLALDDFYFVQAAGGAIPFEWTHPMRHETVMVRFVEPPSYKAFDQYLWHATLQLEVLPPGLALHFTEAYTPYPAP
jgi:hypothetical protein